MSVKIYYELMFGLSVLLAIAYMFRWNKHLDTHITLLFTLIPIADVGYVLMSESSSYEAAVIALKITYLGGCFTPMLILLSVLSVCDIKLKRWHRVLLLLIPMAEYGSVLTIGRSDLFYKSADTDLSGGFLMIVSKQYGIMHTMFYIMVVVYFAGAISAVIYTYFKKSQVSRKILWLLVLPEVLAMLSYFFGRDALGGIEMVPVSYNIALIIFFVIIYRMSLYDISDSAIDSLVRSGDRGFVSFDFEMNYLGSNDTAKAFFPEFEKLTVDRSIANEESMKYTVYKWLCDFRDDDSKDKQYYESAGRTYLININYLFDGRRKRGYQFFISDDTQNRQYISLLNRYNSDLQEEVALKTADIIEMHDKMILGMATMVESRDNSTGGHIRRTSDCVRILIDEMKKDEDLMLDDEFCKDLIKAAPMHDLGKIAVDDAILRKPGRFTDDEYEKMKVHAAEGARIVHEIFEGTNNPRFGEIAENVAHYHHERWDGSGYPEGLKGEEIPLEARIMAIADVYDALVSKRVYKERMSFEKADSIIMEGMGRHFDKHLEKYYVAARPQLEEYYRTFDA